MDEARQLLDSLMGTHRNDDRKEAKKKAGNNFKEDDVCKYYLVGFCPQHEELFRSTKKDVGKCYKVHSDAMKSEFESHPDKTRYQAEYEEKLRRYLEELVRWADDRVAREKRNIASANQQIQEDGPNEVARMEIKQLNDSAQALLSEAEDLADKGMIEESRHKMELAEEIKQKAAHWEEKAKALRSEDVCDICGSRMESGDVSRARFRHQDGKIHLGYVKIRQWLADIIARQKEREERSDRRRRREEEREGGDRDRDRDRGDRGDRDRAHDRDREGGDRRGERPPRGSRSRSREGGGGAGGGAGGGGGDGGCDGLGGGSLGGSQDRDGGGGPPVTHIQGRDRGRRDNGRGDDCAPPARSRGHGGREDRSRDDYGQYERDRRGRGYSPRGDRGYDHEDARHDRRRDHGRAERRRDSRSRHRSSRY